MGNNSSIEWTYCTWNVINGCDKVSPGCKNCYAERVAKELEKIEFKKYSDRFGLLIHPRL